MGDLDWMIDVARACYPSFDEQSSCAWGVANLDNPRVKMVRGEMGFAIGAINSPFYQPNLIRGYQVFLASLPRAGFEPVKLVRFLIRWAFDECGAVSFHFGEATGQNMKPIAKRVGAVADSESYTVTA